MRQLAIYLDDETARRLELRAKEAGKSRSALVRQVLNEKFSNRLPDSWFDLFGTWEDDRTPEEILDDIRSGPEQRARAALD